MTAFGLTIFYPFREKRQQNTLGTTLPLTLPRAIGHCGWELKVAHQVAEAKPPTLDELMIIRLLDPKGIYLRG